MSWGALRILGNLGGAKFLGLKCKLWGSHGPNMAQAQGLLGYFRAAVFGVPCNLENAKWSWAFSLHFLKVMFRWTKREPQDRL